MICIARSMPTHPDAQKILQITNQVAIVDARVTPLEDEFSSTLSEGARWIDRVLSIVTLFASGVLLLIGIGLSSAVLKQVRNSEEQYRNLINTANDAILVIDAQTRVILEANTQACEMLEIPQEQLIGMSESRLYPAAGGDEAGRQLLTPTIAGNARSQDLELLRADGTPVPVEVSASATELSGSPAIVGIFRDIRDRLQAAAILRRSEERFSYLIQNLSDVITVVAVDGTMLYHSPSIERVAGYLPSELLGKSLLAFIHPDDEPAVRAALERVTLKVGSAAPPEYRFLPQRWLLGLAGICRQQSIERCRGRRHRRYLAGCHWPARPRRTSSTIAEDGSGRPLGGRDCPRLQ